MIYAHFLVPAGLVATLASRAPLVVTAHGQDVANVGAIAGVRAATRLVVERSSAVIAVSSWLRRQLEGAIPSAAGKTEVVDCGVDYLACGGHKWLASPTALGFAYASDAFVSRFRPTLTYAATAVPPTGDWRDSWTDPAYDPIQTYALRPDASRFEVGVHHGGLGAAGLVAALEIFEDAVTAVERKMGGKVSRKASAK